ncbi:Holliday junction resolvase RuvX [Candidatus Peregrinibacteria bacterium CG10_big_fil_rev_8_21_14_0_10_49_24]|nr:MAG: Holliday junction resolvase RuvX [Candidatus Peregrinibacteria bacterium CG11_big_fil_rev_8_21_14_0_20_49_14]PIR50976.1 MAG: Holliday junction resolvase RuvX [Candidatus Peregrinibacteria bacterium CG10_big_fil_rev_8_21_14_0_10_49_24]PJA67529.1 MAG: Holliday junction resolvase RuvX [Candidatus Peregrinibacteria bacterium CG_4_9_14_3_um_filter_49_12]
MNILALDIGLRRTGVAFCSADTGVPIALSTVFHVSEDELISQILSLVKDRDIHTVVCGLPLLPGGEEGSQCIHVHSVAEALEDLGIHVSLLDERYSTPTLSDVDPDAAAACQLLLTFCDRQKRGS